MHTNNRHSWINPGRVTTAALVLFLIAVSCSKERSLSPAPVHYRLYASVIKSGGVVINVIDCDTDSLVDVITGFTPYSAHGGLSISPDGHYACIIQLMHNTAGDPALVMDLRTHEIVAELSSTVQTFTFLRDMDILLGYCRDSILVFSSKTFALEDTWPIRYGLYTELRGTSNLIGVAWPLADSEQTDDHSKFTILDTETGAVIDSFRISQNPGEPGLSINGFALFDDGSSLIAIARSGQLAKYDYIKKRLLFETSIGQYWSTLAISPDQTQIGIPESSNEMHPGHPEVGDIVIHDATSGSLIETIRTEEFRLDRPDKPIPLTSIRFVPTLPKAYAGSIDGRPSLLVIDTDTHTITRGLFEAEQLRLYQLVIAPIEPMIGP